MNIPLLNKEDVEKEGEDVEKEGEDIGISIRYEIIEFLKGKGYRYAPSEEDFCGETNDFFIKDDQMVQVIICDDDISDEILALI